MNRKKIVFLLVLAFFVSVQSALGQTADVSTTPIAATADTAVPSLIRYSGVALQNDGNAKSGEASVTFLIFKDEKGGDPLWAETQTVQADESGKFTVHLGAASLAGLPPDLFASGGARWLEVQVAGSVPQPRTLLSSVPYAMKSADAESLAGHAAAEFVTQDQLAALQQKDGKAKQTDAPAFQPEASAPTGAGTASTVPLWTSSSTLGNSIVTQVNGKIGISYAAPTATLEVGGGMTVHGTLFFPPGVPATTAHSSSSQAFQFSASAWNSTTAGPVSSTYTFQAGPVGNNTANPNAIFYLNYQNGANPVLGLLTVNGNGQLGLPNAAGGISSYGNVLLSPAVWATSTAPSNSPLLEVQASSWSSSGSGARAQTFAWQTKPVNSDTASPSGQLALLYGYNGGTPAATGFSIAANGQITFAAGQTFPASGTGGTITGITTTSPLSGSGTKGSVALSLNTSALETTLNSQYAQLAAANTFTQPITFAAGQTFPGAGTITGVTVGTGLTGGGASGAIKIGIDATKVPALTGSPIFNGSAGDGVVGDTSGTTVGTAGVIGVAGAGNTSGFSGIAGLWGNASAHVGVLGTSDQYPGVAGFSNSSYGVQGGSTSGSGIEGKSSGTVTNTAGVLGNAGTGSGIGGVVAGVWGDSYQQVGVEGTSNLSVGIYGQSTGYNGVEGISNTAIGVSGVSTSGTGMAGSSSTGAGMVGYTAGSALNTGGVIGIAGPRTSFSGISGIWGDAANHVGVQGSSNIYTGVQGFSVSGPGVQGNSTSGNGMHGVSASTSGIFGETSSTSGGDAALYGYSHNSAIGVFGFSPKFGVVGESAGNSATGGLSSVFVNGPAAVWGDTGGGGYAVAGTTDNGTAGEFINNSASQEAMYVGNFYGGNSTVATLTGEAGGCTFFGNGDVLCDGKISSAVVTKDGERAVKTYSVQSTENWYEDAGSGQLVNGVAHVPLEATFGQTANTDVAYQVFLTPGGDSEGLYVTNKTADGFEVHEQHGGHSNIAFDYRIMAKRTGHENERLEDVTERMKKQAEGRARMLRENQAAPTTAEAAR